MDVRDRLRQLDILGHFSDSQIELLAGCTSRVRYADGAHIVREGETTQETYLIDRGRVRIERSTPYGLYRLAELGADAMFGETSFIDHHARSGDVVSAGDVDLFPLSPSALEDLLNGDQRFTLALYWALWKSLSQKLRSTTQRLAEFFSKVPAPSPEAGPSGQPNKDFRVGVGAKRDLFREQKLSPLEINFLATLSRERRYGADEVIFREGEPGDCLYVVLDGRVMISKQIADAGEEALAFLERGDYFGEMALIDNEPRSADARAHSDGAVVLAIPDEVLEGILDIHKVSSLRLLRLLSNLIAKRLREIDDKLVGWYIFSAGSGESLDVPS